MAVVESTKYTSIISLIIAIFELLGKAISFGEKVKRGFASEGLYRYRNYESTLELLDGKGRKAIFRKDFEIEFIQDPITSITDIGWVDGKGPLDYQISPGRLADQYKSGHRWHLLISLRRSMHRGDKEKFQVRWKIRDGFLKPDGYWQTDITHRFDTLSVSVVFPKSRPPKEWFVEEANKKRTYTGGEKTKLADGRWKITWKLNNPTLFEQYILRWDW